MRDRQGVPIGLLGHRRSRLWRRNLWRQHQRCLLVGNQLGQFGHHWVHRSLGCTLRTLPNDWSATYDWAAEWTSQHSPLPQWLTAPRRYQSQPHHIIDRLGPPNTHRTLSRFSNPRRAPTSRTDFGHQCFSTTRGTFDRTPHIFSGTSCRSYRYSCRDF